MWRVFLAFIIFVAVIWFIGSRVYNAYESGEKKPFWKGTELMQVCKKPYYSSSDCYKLNVTLIDSNTARINFDKGGYKISSDLICYFAAHAIEGQPKYTFCRSWDAEGQQWDFMPLWAYYPSSEDQHRYMEKFK